MSKPIKSPSRATALLIKKAKRKNEKDNTCSLIWPRHFSSQVPAKQKTI
jgi:hypothetical protein